MYTFFTASDFLPTKWSTADEKAVFGNTLLQMPSAAFGAECRVRENAERRDDGLCKAVKYRCFARSSVGATRHYFPVFYKAFKNCRRLSPGRKRVGLLFNGASAAFVE